MMETKIDTKTRDKIVQRVIDSNPILKNAIRGKKISISDGFKWEKIPDETFVGKKSPTFFRLARDSE